MRKVRVTAEAEAAIRACTRGQFSNDGTRNADGTWDIPFSEDTLYRLNEMSFEGESISDVIVRLCEVSRKELN